MIRHKARLAIPIKSQAGICLWGRVICFFFSSRRRHTRLQGDWSSDVCSSDLVHQILSEPGEHRAVSRAIGYFRIQADKVNVREIECIIILCSGGDASSLASGGQDRKSVV